MTDQLELDAAQAYAKGWAAAGRGVDLDAAETRFLRRFGHLQLEAWSIAWEDRANGRAKRSATDLAEVLTRSGKPI